MSIKVTMAVKNINPLNRVDTMHKGIHLSALARGVHLIAAYIYGALLHPHRVVILGGGASYMIKYR